MLRLGKESPMPLSPLAMFFRRKIWLNLAAVIFAWLPLCGLQETVDRIAAVVNESVITLSDIKIVQAFGLYEDEMPPGIQNERDILERLINQKLVIGLTQENIQVPEEDIVSLWRKIQEKFGASGVEASLEKFGLNEEDLREYLKEKVLYQRIIQARFGLAVIVSLKEIEDYYTTTYVPNQERLGLSPKPMIEILDEIEASLKKGRIEQRVEEWLNNLKRGADIQILLKEDLR